jgi:hypothetical protein
VSAFWNWATSLRTACSSLVRSLRVDVIMRSRFL